MRDYVYRVHIINVLFRAEIPNYTRQRCAWKENGMSEGEGEQTKWSQFLGTIKINLCNFVLYFCYWKYTRIHTHMCARMCIPFFFYIEKITKYYIKIHSLITLLYRLI